jgi:hypothetical protein
MADHIRGVGRVDVVVDAIAVVNYCLMVLFVCAVFFVVFDKVFVSFAKYRLKTL